MQFSSKKSKINKLVLQQNKNASLVENKTTDPVKSIPVPTNYKGAKLLYDSDWFIPELEKITDAITQTKYTVLPEKALYNLSIDLDITEQFLPYLQIEVLARVTPSTRIAGVFPYIKESNREIDIQLYDWNGIGQHSISDSNPCQDPPQPEDAYYKDTISSPGFTKWTFLYPIFNTPVPVGTDPSYLLPVAKEYILPNELIYDFCGVPVAPVFYSSWTTKSTVEFYQFVNLQTGTEAEKLATAKLVLEAYQNIVYSDELSNFKGHIATESNLPLTGNSENDFYAVDEFSVYWVWTSEESEGTIDDWVSAGADVYKAYQKDFGEKVATSKQTKKFTKINDNKFNLTVNGHTLLLSEAKTQTTWSHLLTPTYEPEGEDIELKVLIYIKNPTSYSELKNY